MISTGKILEQEQLPDKSRKTQQNKQSATEPRGTSPSSEQEIPLSTSKEDILQEKACPMKPKIIPVDNSIEPLLGVSLVANAKKISLKKWL